MAPYDWAELQSARSAGDLQAADRIALVLALLGDYETQLDVDADILAATPDAAGPRRRTVFSLLKLGRRGKALRHARELESRAAADPTTAPTVAAARAAVRAGSNEMALTRVLIRFPLVDNADIAWMRTRFYRTRID